MVRGTLRQRVLALVAAYALALQSLFAALGPLAAASDIGTLCSGLQAEGTAGSIPTGSSGHEKTCLSACTMLGAADAPPPPEVCGRAAPARLVQPQITVTAAFVAAPRSPHIARAPPLV